MEPANARVDGTLLQGVLHISAGFRFIAELGTGSLFSGQNYRQTEPHCKYLPEAESTLKDSLGRAGFELKDIDSFGGASMSYCDGSGATPTNGARCVIPDGCDYTYQRLRLANARALDFRPSKTDERKCKDLFRLSGRRCDDNKHGHTNVTFPIDFLVSAIQGTDQTFHEAWLTAITLCEIAAYRRTICLAPSFAARTYHIFLPPAVLTYDGDGEKRFIAVPMLAMTRKHDAAYFRRSMGMTIFFVPVDASGHVRPLEPEELISITSESTPAFCPDGDRLYMLTGPLRDYLGLKGAEHRSPHYWLSLILHSVLRKLLPQPQRGDSESETRLANAVINALNVSLVTGADLLIDHTAADLETLEKWCEKPAGAPPKAESSVAAWLTTGLPEANKPDLPELLMTLPTGVISESLTFYAKLGPTLYTFMSSDLENFPGPSILWAAGGDAMLCRSMAVIKEIIYTFKYEQEKLDRTKATLEGGAEDEDFIEDFDDYYDLHLVSALYKARYTEIKKREGIPADYENLTRHVRSLADRETAIASSWRNRFSAAGIFVALSAGFVAVFSLIRAAFTPFSAPGAGIAILALAGWIAFAFFGWQRLWFGITRYLGILHPRR
jgi:hypothetical protein